MNYLHEDFMHRCLQLAELGAGNVAPNPMVGAILVYNNIIIGEGYHQKYGEAHAEVNCIQSVKKDDAHLIKHSELYISLEPCNHFGKTPPCTDLIIRNKISKVIIGCKDSYTKVDGKGIQQLKDNNIEVVIGVLEKDCRKINKRFFLFHSLKRPYIILKWAQTANDKISSDNDKRLFISNYLSERIVHKWRFEEAGILIGTNTAIKDNPLLTNRTWKSRNPIRLVIDTDAKLNLNLNIFNNDAPTIIFSKRHDNNFPIINIMLRNNNEFDISLLNNKVYAYQMNNEQTIIHQIVEACYKLNIQSILLEGGLKLLQSFIDENLYNEIRIITNKELFVEKGLNAPTFSNCIKLHQLALLNDKIEFFANASKDL